MGSALSSTVANASATGIRATAALL